MRTNLPVALLVLLGGCQEKPVPPPKVADLEFPVVVLYGTATAMLYPNATALGTARIGDLNAVIGPPPLIDSSFKVYTLQDFRSIHGGLWLMLHPTGSTEVTFRLERTNEGGIDAARKRLLERLERQTWRSDLDESRRRLAEEKTLAGMFAIVEGKPK